MDEKIHGYKGFDEGLKCRGFQYEVGKEYETGEAVICEKGFHFCENPLDVLNYYDLCDCTFAEVESTGEEVRHDEDSKVATTKIKIGAKLSLGEFIKASVDFLLKKTTPKDNQHSAHLASSGDSAHLASSGDYAQLASSGDSAHLASSGNTAKLASSGYSAQLASSGDYAKLASSGDSARLASSGYSAHLASSGYSAQLASSGDYARLDIRGQDSVGAAIGINSKIKGYLGSWITLAEWEWSVEKNRYVPLCVKSAQVDGKKIKADTWYILEGGKFREVS